MRAHRSFVVVGPLVVLAVTLTLLLPGGARGADSASLAGLRVLLTNDDSVQATNPLGLDGKGLYEVRRALCAAGADVVAVAPWGQQSGSSARLTTPAVQAPPLTVQQVIPPPPYTADCVAAPNGGPVYGVCQANAPCTPTSSSASPSDSVIVALARFIPANFWPKGPHLVVSGVNFGQNAGRAVNHSGTVGAVVTAGEFRRPAVAFSAEVDLSCTPNQATSLVCVPLADAANFASGFIGKLRAGKMLTPGLLLNVNYPVVRPGEKLGKPVLAFIGTGVDVGFAYSGDVGRNGGTYSVVVGAPVADRRARADTTVLGRNNIPVTVLDADWGTAARERLRRFIATAF